MFHPDQDVHMVTPIVAEIINLQPIGRMAKPYQGRGIFTGTA
jgi:hypothetical protein